MKYLVLSIIALVAAAMGAAEDARALPLPQHPTSFDLAEVANRYIALGEDKAVAELMALCNDAKSEYGIDIDPDTREQMGWICRLVFLPKTNAGLRPPRFGMLTLPFNTMRYEDWPMYPLAESNGVFFVLAQSYSLAGVAEDPRKYIAYCQAEGEFRKNLLIVPSENDAEKALDRLLQADVWKKIKWKDSEWHTGGGGFSYTLHEGTVIDYLRRQTRRADSNSRSPGD